MNTVLQNCSRLRNLWRPRKMGSIFGTCPVLRPRVPSLCSEIIGQTKAKRANISSQYLIRILAAPKQKEDILCDGWATTLKGVAKSLVENIDLTEERIKRELKDCDKAHKTILRSFWKKCLAFNPLYKDVQETIDMRFMKQQVDDPVYKLFEDEASGIGKRAYLYLLRAITGAGKTATILNAIGRNAFTFYVQCNLDQGGKEYKDYVDTPFMDFFKRVDFAVSQIEDKQEATRCCLAYCQVFWLCRLMILEAMKKNYENLTPEQWIWWTNSGGRTTLLDLSLKTELHSWQQIVEPFSKLMNQYHADFPNTWFAIDEAQLIQTNLEHLLIPGEGDKIHKTNLLHVLAVHSLPALAVTLVGGTRMSRFEELIGTYGGKGTSIFKLSEAQENYPYVTSDEALQHLSEWINLDDITKENLDLAKSKLQGRLRYVFGFLRYLYLAAYSRRSHITKTKQEQIQHKNDVFIAALNDLQTDVSNNIERQWERIMAKFKISPPSDQSPLTIPAVTFPEHILTLLIAHQSNEKLTWDAEDLQKRFGVAPEDTGFLYFDKILNPDKPLAYKYVYSIREPQLVPYVVKALRSYFPQKALHKLTTTSGPSDLGTELELIFGIFMARMPLCRYQVLISHQMSPNFNSFLSKHSGNVDWCKNLITKWDNANYGNSLASIPQIMGVLTKLAKVDRTDKAALLKCIDNLRNALFKSFGTRRQIPETDIDLLLEIAAKYKSSKDVAKELLFMYARPDNFLLRPSNSMGPDLVGFCKTSDGSEVLVLVSISFTPSYKISKFEFKFQKNQYKQEPDYFYSKLTDEAQSRAKIERLDYRKVLTPIDAKTIFEKIDLPECTLMLHATMPDTHRYEMDDLGGNAVRIYINQSNLKDFSVGLDEFINNRLQKRKEE